MQMHAAEQRPPQSVTCWAAAGRVQRGLGRTRCSDVMVPLCWASSVSTVGVLPAVPRKPASGNLRLELTTDHVIPRMHCRFDA